jgi:hypothetical protein
MPQGIMRFWEQHDVIDQAMRKREAVPDVQGDAGKVCSAGKQGVNPVEHRGNEEERKFDGFGDARKKGCEGSRDHDATHFRALIQARGAPDCESRSGQAKHLEKVASCHSAGGGIAVDEAGDLAMYHGAGGGIGVIPGLEEEGNVPDMVQSEGDGGALDHSVDGEGDGRTLMNRPWENASMTRSMGGHTKLRTAPAAMTAKAVMIGTERLPAKKPR